MGERSIWGTWKPYAVIGVLFVAGFWWWNSQAPFAPLKDGAYDCLGVYVNDSGKYEILIDDAGSQLRATARVEGGELRALTGDTSLSSGQLTSLTMRTKGTTHFHVTDDPAIKMYNAVACDYSD